jgi:hypothetical protein
MNPLSPKTYLPPCPDCAPDDSSPDEYVCEKCEGVIVVCDCCHVCVNGCECGHCKIGAYLEEQ